jgi:hypothetical protein
MIMIGDNIYLLNHLIINDIKNFANLPKGLEDWKIMDSDNIEPIILCALMINISK